MPELVALDFGPSDEFVAALSRVWDDGNAAMPVDQRLPEPARRALFAAMRPTQLWSPSGRGPLESGVEVESGDALVVATSGTTGDPKGVVLTLAAVRAAAMMTSDAIDVDIDLDRWLLCLPVAHMGGLMVAVRSILTGVPITTLPKFDRHAVEAASGRGANLVSLVPAAIEGLDVSRFRKVLLGGSSIPAERPIHAIATYGLTESCGGIIYNGHALAGVEIEIDDGEVLLRSPTLLRTYRFGDDPKTEDGWLRTGDMGALDSDGKLTVHGRRDEMIVSGGHNVFPGPVEEVLSTLGGVEDVAVIGRPDDTWGEAVSALIVPSNPDAPPSLDEVRGWAKAQLPFYAAPTRLELVSEIPRTAIGKIRRSEL